VAALVAAAAVSVGLHGGPAAADPTPPALVSFTADDAVITTPGSTVLRASADRELSNSGYVIAIVDDDGESSDSTCDFSPCPKRVSANWSDNSKAPRERHFHAEIRELGSGAVVSRLDATIEIQPHDFQLDISADDPSITAPDSTVVRASLEEDLSNTGYQIHIIDDDGESSDRTCDFSPCPKQVTATWTDNANPRPRHFHAEVRHISNGHVAAVSNPVTVTIEPYDFDLEIAPDASSITVPDSTVVRATVNGDLNNTGYRIHIVDDDGESSDSTCDFSPCPKLVTAPWSVNPNPTARHFHAEVRSFVTGHLAATSDQITVVRRRFIFDVDLDTEEQAEGGWRATATTNHDVYNTGYQLKIKQTGGNDICSVGSGTTCGPRTLTVGNTYRAVVEDFNGHVAGQSAAWTLTDDGPVEEKAGDVDLAALALALEGTDLCTRVGLAPYKTEVVPPATSGGDQWELCVNLVQAGKGTLAILAAIAAMEGGQATINWLVSDALKEAPPPETEPDADDATAPRPVPPPFLPDVEKLAQTLTQTQDVPQDIADDVANQCLFLHWRAGQSGKNDCRTLPIFASGNDVPEATIHDLEALASSPFWVSLNYRHRSETPGDREWMNSEAECLDRVPGVTSCDEYPFWATMQGGPFAVKRPHLKLISSADNRDQGLRYGNFVQSCHMNTGDAFLGIPLAPQLGVPTQTRICNGH